MNSFGEDRRDFWRCHHRRQWAAIANTLSHGNDVGNDPLVFKAPEMRSRAAKSRLNFVSYANSAGPTHMLINMLEIAIWKNNDATDSLNRFCDEAGDLPRCGKIDQLLYIRRVFLACIRIVPAMRTTIGIRHGGVMDAKAVRHIKFPGAVRRHTHPGSIAAMVRVA